MLVFVLIFNNVRFSINVIEANSNLNLVIKIHVPHLRLLLPELSFAKMQWLVSSRIKFMIKISFVLPVENPCFGIGIVFRNPEQKKVNPGILGSNLEI